MPGLVLAIAYPDKQVTLLDGNGKRIRFLKQVKFELKISNIYPVHSRAEKFQTTDCFDGIISRAVGSITELMSCTKHLLCPQGRWYAMKGNYPDDELSEVSNPYKVERLQVPKLDAARHLVIIES